MNQRPRWEFDRLRVLVFTAGALITGVMVAFLGIIGFVGLVIPHVVRLLTGGNFCRLIPCSALGDLSPPG